MSGEAVLQQLWDDHRVSAHLLDVFVRALDAPGGRLPADLWVLRDIVARECRYGDGVHHAREELLFERMRARSDVGENAVSGLSREHDELAKKGATLLESIEAALAGRPEDPRLLRQRALDYADALRNHMSKEEQRVFPLAAEILHHDDWRAVGEAFATRVDPLAPPVAEELRALGRWLDERGESVYPRR